LQGAASFCLVQGTPEITKTQGKRGKQNNGAAPGSPGGPPLQDAAKEQLFHDWCRDDAQKDYEEPLDTRRMRLCQPGQRVLFEWTGFPNPASPDDENVN
jgi:hypothetical protein